MSPSRREPADVTLRAWLAAQHDAPLSVPAGLSLDGGRGWTVDEASIPLGTGGEVFRRACDALRDWRQFPAGWTRIHPARAPLEVGVVVAVVARVLGLWWLNGARIVEAIDEPARFGLVYATLPSHAERGLERFVVERSGDEVSYSLRAISRPRHPLARLGYPITRLYQRRFRRDSLAGMRQAVADG